MSGASSKNRTVAVQYDLTGNPIADHDLSGTSAVWTYRVYGPGLDECLGEYRRPNSRRTYQLHDALGSVTAVANDAGQVAYRSTYKAFGDMSRTADATGITQTRLGYTSREISVGGLMQCRSRYYDSGYGRFLQQDGYLGDTAKPPSLDRYTYALNRPVNYNDPTGAIPTGTEVAFMAVDFIALFMVVVASSSEIGPLLAKIALAFSFMLNIHSIWDPLSSVTTAHKIVLTAFWFMKWLLVGAVGYMFESTKEFIVLTNTYATAFATALYQLIIGIVLFAAEKSFEEDMEKYDDQDEFEKAWSYAWLHQ